MSGQRHLRNGPGGVRARARSVREFSRRALVACALGLPLAFPASALEGAIRESKFELFVTDVASSVRFYEALGFRIVHAKPDGYTTMQSQAAVVALSPVPSWLPLRWLGFLRNPPLGTEIVLYTDEIEQARASLEAAGHSPGPITLQPWGDRDFRVRDYEGYYVRVSEGTAVPRPETP